MPVPKKIPIATYHAKKGENIVHLLIAFGKEMVSIKDKLNEIIKYLEEKEKGGDK